MLSKARITIVTLIAAFGVATLTAVPASAARNVCNLLASGQIECHQARQCVVKWQGHPDLYYDDGETVTINNKTYKCNDGSWELAYEVGGKVVAEPPKYALELPSAPPPRTTAAPPPAGALA